MAHAVVSLPPAVIESFKNAGGYPWGLFPATAMLAEGAAQIASIKSTSFSGGGSVRGVGGGSGGSSGPGELNSNILPDPVLPGRDQSGQQINITTTGDVMTLDGDQFADRVVKAVKRFTDADGVIIQTGTAQAQQFASG